MDTTKKETLCSYCRLEVKAEYLLQHMTQHIKIRNEWRLICAICGAYVSPNELLNHAMICKRTVEGEYQPIPSARNEERFRINYRMLQIPPILIRKLTEARLFQVIGKTIYAVSTKND